MSYVEFCRKHGEYKGDFCGDCVEQMQSALSENVLLLEENKKLRFALEDIVSLRSNESTNITCCKMAEIARSALESL